MAMDKWDLVSEEDAWMGTVQMRLRTGFCVVAWLQDRQH